MFEILFYRVQALYYRACARLWRGITALLEHFVKEE